MTLRLRCIRCGDMAEMEPTENWTLGLCARCEIEGMAILKWSKAPSAFVRWLDRWQKNQERHPTYKALVAALDNLPEPGTLEVGHV